MKIHEYQAQALLKEYGVPVLDGIVASTPQEASDAALTIGLPVVLKAQVHSGGRGKAGGVRVVGTADAVAGAAEAILALTIKGLPVRKVLVARAASIRAEAYLSLLIDRAVSKLVFVGCAVGGVDIEDTAQTTPEKILRLELPAARRGPASPQEYASFAAKLFAEPSLAGAVVPIMAALECLFRARDCALIEINPLAVTADNALLALDAKILLDDNALFRQPGNVALRDPDSEDPAEAEARAAGLTFIGLGGTIGCMVNGAGLAMATLDTIKHLGGEPANFLDVGGSSSPQKILGAFRIILRNPQVKVILVNIFGGITRCDDVARGMLAAMQETRIAVPLVIRLVGTNEQEGRELLAGQTLTVARTLEEAAEKAVELARNS
ncbi:MAG: ADP-forming succinate--CoA ligase subunit beta [Planctomycetota bacterium]|nr:ADP-forming succinate--CoA ligase subunit beta [Planctomycetota bacterium]